MIVFEARIDFCPITFLRKICLALPGDTSSAGSALPLPRSRNIAAQVRIVSQRATAIVPNTIKGSQAAISGG
jgi:hypothetical protein